jgi:hypothetical protein
MDMPDAEYFDACKLLFTAADVDKDGLLCFDEHE